MLELLLYCVFGADIRGLGSDDWATREQAQRRLETYGRLTWPLLSRKFQDLERDRRAKKIVRGDFPRLPPLLLLAQGVLIEWRYPMKDGMSHTTTDALLEERLLLEGWLPGWVSIDRAGLRKKPLACLALRYLQACRQQHYYDHWHSFAEVE